MLAPLSKHDLFCPIHFRAIVFRKNSSRSRVSGGIGVRSREPYWPEVAVQNSASTTMAIGAGPLPLSTQSGLLQVPAIGRQYHPAWQTASIL